MNIMKAAVVLATVLVATTGAAAQEEIDAQNVDQRGGRIRVDLYNDDSQREGKAIINERTGRIDFYDVNSNRKGYGKIRGNRVDLYNNDSERQGKATIKSR